MTYLRFSLSESYFSNGQIRYGSDGVDLAKFNSVEKDIKRAVERTWGA
jgi:hypothetical protein